MQSPHLSTSPEHITKGAAGLKPYFYIQKNTFTLEKGGRILQ